MDPKKSPVRRNKRQRRNTTQRKNRNTKSTSNGGRRRRSGNNINRLQVPAPYNTNSFLMQEHMPESEGAIRTSNNDLSTLAQSTVIIFPFIDEAEEFSTVYETAKYERLESLTKPQLIEEYLKLETRYEQLLNQRRQLSIVGPTRHPRDATPQSNSEDSESDSSTISSSSSSCSSACNSSIPLEEALAVEAEASVNANGVAGQPDQQTVKSATTGHKRHRTHRQRRNSRMQHQNSLNHDDENGVDPVDPDPSL